MEDQRQISALDYDHLDIRSCAVQENLIIFHSSESILNYFLLDLVRRHISTRKGHILIITPSEPAVTQHTRFLRRHLLIDSIGPDKDNEYPGSWPMVLVRNASKLFDLCQNCSISNFELVIILECHDAMQEHSVIEFVAALKKVTVECQPKLYCFTSCIVVDTCEPREMRQHVKALEEFYGCKLLSTCDQFATRRNFSRPAQSIIGYEKQEIASKPCIDALGVLNTAKDSCKNVSFQFGSRFSEMFQVSSDEFVMSTFSKIQHHMEDLGEYGGSIAVLPALRDLVRLYTFVHNSPGHTTRHILSHLVCSLTKFRKILEDDMFRVQLCERGERFSSKKVQLLLNHLENLPKSRRALVLVENLDSASILTLILQKIVAQGKNHSHRKPELMINCMSIPISEEWDDVLSWERNMEVYSRFVKGETNTVVFCGDLRGLDLPCSDLVVVMDNIKNFSHYLQVKSLVKEGCGNLILLTPNTNVISYQMKVENLQRMEVELEKMLTDIAEEDVTFTTYENGFKTPLGTEIKPNELVAIIYRYCKSLPCDKFTLHWPVWKMKKYSYSTTLYCAVLQLPRVSPLHKIESAKLSSWHAAQQNAALNACQELYKMKEITDDILVSWQAAIARGPTDKVFVERVKDLSQSEPHIFRELERELFKLGLDSKPQEGLAEDEDILCDTIFPLSLTAAQPLPDKEAILHKLKIWPVSEAPPWGDNRKTVLYELLCNKSTFAILSSKPLLKVCEFPVFLFGHELSVEIEVNVCKVKLAREEIRRLRTFHCGLFMNILPIVQQFMQFDVFNSHNSYFIVPLTSDGIIDWNVVDNNFTIPEARKLTPEEKADLVCTRETHERTMVKPWYRHLMRDQVYLVSTVCTDMNAESCFPTDDFDSFLHYYSDKYKIILDRPELPLLEVYIINTKVNGLLPRTRSHKMRREEKMEDFREHMVPELCISLQFPAALWLKLSALPTVLHRLTRLLVVEEFSRMMINETGVGASENNLHRLCVDKLSLKDGLQGSKVPPSTVKRGLAIGNVKLEDRKRMAQLNKPWKEMQEPVDIYRLMESLNFVEIRFYDEFLIESLSKHHHHHHQHQNVSHTSPPEDLESSSDCEENPPESSSKNHLIAAKKETMLPKLIKLLRPKGTNKGPQQYELLEVFTSTTSNDGLNMDRAQVLGNSFLKLTISVYAYKNCVNKNSSRTSANLHQIRSTFMSKGNLVKCAVKSKLCNRIKVLDFTPGEWIPPSFTTPSILKQVLKDQAISPNVLQQIHLTETEQLTGVIDEESQEEILDVLFGYVSRSSLRRDEAYVDCNCVPNQLAASCVEALVGTYFQNCGWQGALKVIGWLQLLPLQNLEILLDCENVPDCASTSVQVFVSLDSLESNLKYSFHNKALLLQALTHESYIHPVFQGNMGPLAFLGGSILDFLITCYIHEHFDEFSPLQIWRIREIVSSTSTLAFFAVRHQIHKFLLSNSSSLLDVVDRFVKQQKGCQQTIDDEVQLLMEEHECDSALQVEVPDVLAELLRSLVGAVYLDSGKSLSVTWDTFQNIFLPELDMWRQNVPLSVVDLLKDLSPAAHQVIFSTKEDNGRVEVTCKILMDNTREEVFVARGYDEAKTKTHAAKLALRNLFGTTYFNY